MPTTLPRVSMRQSAHYVTQQRVFDLMHLGPMPLLSDKRIDAYILQGRYGSDLKRQVEERLAAEKRAQRAKKPKLTVKQLIARYHI